MKTGIFLPNGSNGYIISNAVEPYLPTFEHNMAITLEAEKYGMDFVLSMMKFKGFGGDTGYWDACLESFTLMSALASRTEKIGLFPSVTLLSQHPAYVARMISTIDDISGGRCGLNIVTGWNKPEYSQMGLWRGDEYYDARYDYATEYLSILKALWRDGTCTHKSDYFELDNCSCLPTPEGEIPIVSAGQSPKGVEFVARSADRNFVMAHPGKLKAISDGVKEKGLAQGRNVGTYALFGLITAETDQMALEIGNEIIHKADKAAISNIISSAQLDLNKGGTSDHLQAALEQSLEVGNMAFMGFPVIHGSFDTVARKIDEIAESTGIDGMLFSWADFVTGVRDFGQYVMPQLKCLQ